VEIPTRPAKKRRVDDDPIGGPMSPSNRGDPGNEADPVGGENEDEDGREKPERALAQLGADDALQEIVQPADEPLQEVLGTFGNALHVARRDGLNGGHARRYDPAA